MRCAFPRRLPLIVFVALTLVSCITEPKVALTGQIRDMYTDQPIEGGQVTLGERSGIPTDSDGRWTTQEWSADDVAILQATGYESATVALSERPELQATQAVTQSLDVALR